MGEQAQENAIANVWNQGNPFIGRNGACSMPAPNARSISFYLSSRLFYTHGSSCVAWCRDFRILLSRIRPLEWIGYLADLLRVTDQQYNASRESHMLFWFLCFLIYFKNPFKRFFISMVSSKEGNKSGFAGSPFLRDKDHRRVRGITTGSLWNVRVPSVSGSFDCVVI
ncbi:hypothetical protein HG535_0D02820 [Zygotorulaspora mrakii]|uniref:Uncharacterized protein n=1 Tax=Zygotorulaspora mrakii TaxID=42260 RepID=A0A7H9B2G4_ZYGMR|nr:uncharacterized protein HG535_0D02820 [Zygotorulaspora mrakii]QLG72574.1 hypothetical protein HG535_0D02820 [Zygotorulaspora mrakii]